MFLKDMTFFIFLESTQSSTLSATSVMVHYNTISVKFEYENKAIVSTRLLILPVLCFLLISFSDVQRLC